MLRKTALKCFCLMLLGIVITPCYSYSLLPYLLNGIPVFSIGAGMSDPSNVGESKDFPIQNTTTQEFYNYTANSSTQTSHLFEFFLGSEWNLRPNWLLQAGLDYNQTSPFVAQGTFIQGADAESANSYNYTYYVLTRQLLAEGKLLYTVKKCYHPYFLLGLGASFNKAYNYYTSVPRFLTFTRMYANNSTTSLSYVLGVGLDFDVTSCVRLGLGYRFTDLGNVRLGSATIDTTPVSGTLSQSHFYINELLAQLSFVFN